jgi:ArsR family transcriptional regulator
MVEEYIPSGEILDGLVCFFSVFSDPTRVRILSALAISEMCVTDLSRMLSLNQTTVSHQLRFLKNVGIVQCKRQGKIIFYSLLNDTVNEVLLKGVEFLGY